MTHNAMNAEQSLAEVGQLLLESLHEMNNPLAGISMGIQLLEMSMASMRQATLSEPPDREKLLGLIERNEEQLTRMTHAIDMLAKLKQDIADYGKPIAPELKPEVFREVVERALSSFLPQSRFQEMTVETDFLEASPQVMCQSDRLEQVLFNLLKNAAEATEARGTVWLTERLEGDMVVLEIEDSGPGFPDEILPRLFTPFVTSKPATGSGLGLSICRRIIHQHRGDIYIYNKPERGACLRVTLPVAKREA